MWNMHEGFGWWAVVGSLWVLLFWGILFWLLLRLFAPRDGRGGQAPPTPHDATEIARQRYASGEISREEFLRIMEDIRSS